MSRAFDRSADKLRRRAAEMRALEEARIPWCGWALTTDRWELVCTETSAEAAQSFLDREWSHDCRTVVLRQGQRPDAGDDQGGPDVLPFPMRREAQ